MKEIKASEKDIVEVIGYKPTEMFNHIVDLTTEFDELKRELSLANQALSTVSDHYVKKSSLSGFLDMVVPAQALSKEELVARNAGILTRYAVRAKSDVAFERPETMTKAEADAVGEKNAMEWYRTLPVSITGITSLKDDE